MKKKIISAVTALSALALSALPVYAAWPPTGGLPAGTDLKAIIGSIITGIIVLVGAIATFFLVYGGILYLTSGGDKFKVEQAKSTLTAAITGLIIALASYLIIKLIYSWLGLTL